MWVWLAECVPQLLQHEHVLGPSEQFGCSVESGDNFPSKLSPADQKTADTGSEKAHRSTSNVNLLRYWVYIINYRKMGLFNFWGNRPLNKFRKRFFHEWLMPVKACRRLLKSNSWKGIDLKFTLINLLLHLLSFKLQFPIFKLGSAGLTSEYNNVLHISCFRANGIAWQAFL